MLSAANARLSHKWLMRIIGLQCVIWALSGLYMVSMNIHFIHGESLSREPVVSLPLAEVNYSFAGLMTDYPDASNITLTRVLNQTVYRFQLPASNGRWHLINGATGTLLPPISQQQAVRIARQQYTGTAEIVDVQQQAANQSTTSGSTALWKVSFADLARSTFYIHPDSGQVIRRRHHYWYAFDWLWRLHIMDYDDGENVTNLLLRIASILGLLATFSGLTLLCLQLSAKWRSNWRSSQ